MQKNATTGARSDELVFSKAISVRYQETLMQAIGVCGIFVGL